MELSIHSFIRKHELIQDGDAILLAVSGGPDSMAMLHWFVQQRVTHQLRLRVAHVNHHLRGAESDADQHFVEEICQQWEVPCTSVAIDVERFIQEQGLSKQAAARAGRYEALGHVAEQFGFKKVAMAHHGDDQVETVLMRLIRGTGLQGLTGIPPQRETGTFTIVRPFLELSRADIEQYCQHYQISSREDSSNLKDDYTRNYLRHHVTPILAHLNPKLHTAVSEMSDVLREENEWLEAEAKSYVSQVMESKEKHKMTIDLSKFRHIPLPLQRRGILLILNCLPDTDRNWTKRHIDQLLQLCAQEKGDKLLHLPHKITAHKQYGKLTLMKQNTGLERIVKQKDIRVSLPVEGEVIVPELSVRVTLQRGLDLPATEVKAVGHRGEQSSVAKDWDTKHTAYFDLQELTLPLIIRNRKTGDKIQPLGMKGQKKVKDIFIDAKIPLNKRNNWPLITDQHDILWIPGIKRANQAKVHQETKQCIVITVEKF